MGTIIIVALCLVGLIAVLASYLMFYKLPMIHKVPYRHTDLMLSIIIPARNEEGSIDKLLVSLGQQNYANYEVLVIDDESTDSTADVANKFGARVIPRKKDEWRGKSAACWFGALEAKGEVFLFLDADTRFSHENALANMMEVYVSKGGKGLFSIQPYHAIQKGYENLSILFNIILMVGMNVFTFWRGHFQSAGAFGPCIITNRKDYFLAGGHKQVGSAVMDGLELSKAYSKLGLPTICMGGKGTINFRMYPNGVKELVEGWTKSFASGSTYTHPIVMLLIYSWIAGGILSVFYWFLPIINQDFMILLIIYALFFMRFYQIARNIGSFSLFYCLFYPVFFVFFVILFMRSLYFTKIKKEVKWKDRKIQV